MATPTRHIKRRKSGDTPSLGEAFSAGVTRATRSDFGAQRAKKDAAKDIKAGRVTTKAKTPLQKDKSRLPAMKHGGVVKKKGKRY